MVRVFVEVLRDSEDGHLVESDFEVAFMNASSLNSEKLDVFDFMESDDGNPYFILDYYGTFAFSLEQQDDMVTALEKECGSLELVVSSDEGWPTPNWAYRVMETDYK
tara:strand:- start:374 stop:694 length:321 start_codon:yes stop_codon:yes gene_type:complete